MIIGVLGAGQLGRMLALAGYPLGFKFAFAGEEDSASAKLLGTYFKVDLNQPESLDDFLDHVDIVTFETENISLKIAEYVASKKTLYPGVESLKVTQHRVKEKDLFKLLKIPTSKFHAIEAQSDLENAANNIGFPMVIKTVTLGYDGKGQQVVHNKAELLQAWENLGTQAPLISEKFINFKREVSIIAVRNKNKQIEFYPLTENYHKGGILRYSVALVEQQKNCKVTNLAKDYVQKIMDHLDHIGVLTLEMFETENGDLLANEIAPRVHNSGHWTQNGASVSQFENHLRAIANLPLGATKLCKPSAMVNLIGSIIAYNDLLEQQNIHLHLYDKTERYNRKLGHINLTSDSVVDANSCAKNIYKNIDK